MVNTPFLHGLTLHDPDTKAVDKYINMKAGKYAEIDATRKVGEYFKNITDKEYTDITFHLI